MDFGEVPGEPDSSSVTPDQLALMANETIESAVNLAAQQAFNLGCLVGLLPMIAFIILTFLLSGFSIISAFIAVILGVISAIAFANLAAMLARKNTIPRVYHDIVKPRIAESLEQSGISRNEFASSALRIIAETAPLYEFITEYRTDDPNRLDKQDGKEPK